MLRCEECDATAEAEARGWRAYPGREDEDDEDAEFIVYCPACAEHEFGARVSRTKDT